MTHPPLADAARTPPRIAASVAVTLVLAAVLWIGWAAALLLCVPRFERVFRDFNLELSGPTQFVIGASHWFNHYWYIAPYGLLLVLGIAAGGLLLFQQRGGRWASRLWAVAMVALPAAVLVFTAVALYVPYLKILENLSR